MRHRKKGAKLGRSVSHRKALLKNLSKELIKNGRIKTTHPKAKALRPFIEKLVTLGKNDTLHSRRQAYKKIENLLRYFSIISHPNIKIETVAISGLLN